MVLNPLTTLLPKPVKFQGLKMQGRASKQSIFRFYNTSTFNAMRFDQNPFTYQCKKENKKAEGFKFCTFSLRFQVTSWQ